MIDLKIIDKQDKQIMIEPKTMDRDNNKTEYEIDYDRAKDDGQRQ